MVYPNYSKTLALLFASAALVAGAGVLLLACKVTFGRLLAPHAVERDHAARGAAMSAAH